MVYQRDISMVYQRDISMASRNKTYIHQLLLLMRHMLMFATCMVAGITDTWAQDSDVKLAEWFKTTQINVSVTDMYPLKYSEKHGLWEFSLTLRNDSALVYLPYVGQVYTTVFHGDGLNFDHKYSNMKVAYSRKHDGKVITFMVRHKTIDYRFTVTVYDNQNATIVVMPTGADMCRYEGKWTAQSFAAKPAIP